MSAKSKIEWTDATWNPVTGCTKVSEGCRNCYAERMTNRFYPGRDFSEVRLHPARLDEPLHWKKPRRIFVCSMSDLFHKDVPDDFILDVFKRMMLTGWHTYMVLTKRPVRMMEFCNKYFHAPLPAVWLGVTAENQAMADERIPILLQTPAVVRFVSVEPMLEKVNLVECLQGWKVESEHHPDCDGYCSAGLCPIPVQVRTPALNWVICGAESGPDARPFDVDWARNLKSQCVSAGVPFFFKQSKIDGKLVKMPELDGRVYAEYPK